MWNKLCSMWCLVGLSMSVCAMEVDLPTIHDAVKQGDLALVEHIVTDNPTCVALLDEYGKFPLYYAAGADKEVVARFLLEHKAPVNQQDDDGVSALHVAAMHGHIRVVRVLLERGAKMYLKTIQGHAPATYAIINRHKHIVYLMQVWRMRQRLAYRANLSVMMAMHPRLGADCPLQALSADVLRMITECFQPMDCSEIVARVLAAKYAFLMGTNDRLGASIPIMCQMPQPCLSHILSFLQNVDFADNVMAQKYTEQCV